MATLLVDNLQSIPDDVAGIAQMRDLKELLECEESLNGLLTVEVDLSGVARICRGDVTGLTTCPATDESPWDGLLFGNHSKERKLEIRT